MTTTPDNEPTREQQTVIDELRRGHYTIGCARCQQYGTRAWLVAVFDRDGRELKRWRVLPNGDTYEVLPGTPSARQEILPPSEPGADVPDDDNEDLELRLVVRRKNLAVLTDHVACTAFRLVQQHDGRRSLAVEHRGMPSPMIDTRAGFVAGTLDDLPPRQGN